MATKKKGVGIILLYRSASSGKLFAILQVRAKWNSEKNGPESYPGACQVTAHGRLEEGETFFLALKREVEEELGEEIAHLISIMPVRELKELIDDDSPEKQNITFGAIVALDICQSLLMRKKTRIFGGFRILQHNEVDKILDLRTFDKTKGVTDEKVIAMFPDEREAVRLAFEKFG